MADDKSKTPAEKAAIAKAIAAEKAAAQGGIATAVPGGKRPHRQIGT